MEKIKLPQGKSINSFYDKEADVLYVSFGDPKTSETLDTGEDLLIRFDPETGELTGFTILNFSEFGEEIEELIAAKAVA
jgi:uncharacterized protein YuzE